MENAKLKNENELDFVKLFHEVLDEAIQRAISEKKNPPKASDPDMFTRGQTAKMLCVSLPTLHSWTKNGLIRAYRIGSRVLYKKIDMNILNHLHYQNGPFHHKTIQIEK